MSFSPIDLPPNATELEVSLFGPGIGECIVAHLGFDNWMIVDSCLSADKSTSVAISYLRKLGVEVDDRVKLFVITHWHADHIAGARSIISECSNARVVLSGAWRSKEFAKLITASLTPKLINRRGAGEEIQSVFDKLKARGRSLGDADHWAQDGMRLFDHMGVSVTALSPSSETVTAAAMRLAELLPKEGTTPVRVPPVRENDQSIVLQIDTKQFSTLLGGDLEVSSSERRGWNAVLASPVRPKSKSTVFKVSHHGSSNGDTAKIWLALLERNPVALVSPYVAGRKQLPSVEDVARITARPAELYCTVWPIDRKPVRRNPGVDRTLREMVHSHRTISKTPGHIRIRVPLEFNGKIETVELFDGATCLSAAS